MIAQNKDNQCLRSDAHGRALSSRYSVDFSTTNDSTNGIVRQAYAAVRNYERDYQRIADKWMTPFGYSSRYRREADSDGGSVGVSGLKYLLPDGQFYSGIGKVQTEVPFSQRSPEN